MIEPFLDVVDNRKVFQKRADRFLRFDSGEMGAKTQVATTAKRDVVGVLPFDIEAIRVGVDFRVSICSSQRKMK
jgi:hypothetical protein